MMTQRLLEELVKACFISFGKASWKKATQIRGQFAFGDWWEGGAEGVC